MEYFSSAPRALNFFTFELDFFSERGGLSSSWLSPASSLRGSSRKALLGSFHALGAMASVLARFRYWPYDSNQDFLRSFIISVIVGGVFLIHISLFCCVVYKHENVGFLIFLSSCVMWIIWVFRSVACNSRWIYQWHGLQLMLWANITAP